MKNLILFLFLLISFAVIGQSDSVPEKLSNVTDTTIYDMPDQMPVFPGGEAQMMKYIQKNVEYPPDAKAAHITGTCYASFIC
jgi:periplasmic protein TonB